MIGPILSGDPSFRCSMALNAASRSSSLIIDWSGDSESEFGADSGGEIIAPGGIAAWFNGGGDWRRLAWGSIMGPVSRADSAVCTGDLELDGLLRWRRTYEVEE